MERVSCSSEDVLLRSEHRFAFEPDENESDATHHLPLQADQPTPVDGPRSKLDSARSAIETDPRRPSSYLDSSTLALPPVFQPLPAHFPSDFFSTRSHPWNRSGFRYLACGPSTESFSSDTDRSSYLTIETTPPGVVKWSWEDRSSYVYITKDGLSVTTDKGFRSARANLPIREGRWYFEVIMIRAGGELNPGTRSDPEEAHVRVGLARRESGLNAPLGIDGYSYAIRDKTGEKVHLSRPQKYGEPFRSGDVIGILVDLPKIRQPQDGDRDDPARIERSRIPIRFRRQLYFESIEYPVSKEMEDLAESALPSKLKQAPKPHEASVTPAATKKKTLPGQRHIDPQDLLETTSGENKPLARSLPVLKGSSLAFCKNGIFQGVAFRDLLDFLPLRSDSSSQNTVSDQVSENGWPDPSPSSKSAETLHDDGTLGYYPSVSVYGGGIARLNAGPEFKFSPPRSIESLLNENLDGRAENSDSNGSEYPTALNRSWRPLSELYPLYMAEQRKLDELDAMDNKNRLTPASQPVELLNKPKTASKRKRASSPNATTLGATVAKGKKKGRMSTPGDHHLQPTTFKPSPLGHVEVFDGEETTTPTDSIIPGPD